MGSYYWLPLPKALIRDHAHPPRIQVSSNRQHPSMDSQRQWVPMMSRGSLGAFFVRVFMCVLFCAPSFPSDWEFETL